MCERPLIGSTSACACVQTGRGGGAVARTSLPAPLHHRSERLERLVSATVLPPSTLCTVLYGIQYVYTIIYKPITENSNCTLLLLCTRYSYPWVRGALSTESRISVKRRSIQDCPGLGPLWYDISAARAIQKLYDPVHLLEMQGWMRKIFSPPADPYINRSVSRSAFQFTFHFSQQSSFRIFIARSLLSPVAVNPTQALK